MVSEFVGRSGAGCGILENEYEVADLVRERVAASWRWLRYGWRKSVDHLNPKQTWNVKEA